MAGAMLSAPASVLKRVLREGPEYAVMEETVSVLHWSGVVVGGKGQTEALRDSVMGEVEKR